MTLFITSKTPLLCLLAQRDVVPQQLQLFICKTKFEPCEIHKDSSLWRKRKEKKQMPPNAKLDNFVIFCLLALLMALEMIKILENA